MFETLITVLPDVAPDPVSRTFSILPVILVGAVVLVCIVLLKKFFRKK